MFELLCGSVRKCPTRVPLVVRSTVSTPSSSADNDAQPVAPHSIVQYCHQQFPEIINTVVTSDTTVRAALAMACDACCCTSSRPKLALCTRDGTVLSDVGVALGDVVRNSSSTLHLLRSARSNHSAASSNDDDDDDVNTQNNNNRNININVDGLSDERQLSDDTMGGDVEVLEGGVSDVFLGASASPTHSTSLPAVASLDPEEFESQLTPNQVLEQFGKVLKSSASANSLTAPSPQKQLPQRYSRGHQHSNINTNSNSKDEEDNAVTAEGNEEVSASTGSFDIPAPPLLADDEHVLYLIIDPSCVFMKCVTAPQLFVSMRKVGEIIRAVNWHVVSTPELASVALDDDDGVREVFKDLVVPNSARLGYDDLRALHYACYLKDCPRLLDAQPHGGTARPLINAVARLFSSSPVLRRCWFADYRTGDVVFYDLNARLKMGDFVSDSFSTSVYYYMQRTYDPLSHSGLMVQGPTGPKLLHGLSNRLKSLGYPLFAVYMPRRRVDLSRIFINYSTLPEDVKVSMEHMYVSAMLSRAMRHSEYKHQTPGFWTGLWQVIGWGSNSSSGSMNATLSRAPGTCTTAMCSGFTAALLYEALEEVRGKTNELILSNGGAEIDLLEFRDVMRRDILAMTPKDLHQWGVWEVDNPAPIFDRIVSVDVCSAHMI